MNNVSIEGTICTDIYLKHFGDGKRAAFNVAVKREFKNKEGVYQADFIRCQVWGNTATFVEKYFAKGKRIGIVGRLQTRKFTAQDGTEHQVTEVIAEKVMFTGENVGKQKEPVQQTENTGTEYGYPDAGDNSELPF